MSINPNTKETRALQKEAAALDARMGKMFAKHFESYAKGTSTRRRTTSFNAAYGQANDRLQWIRSELRKEGLFPH